MKKEVGIGAILGLVLVLPIVPFLLSPQAKLRYNEVNIFSDINIVRTSNQEILNDHGAIWAKITDNRRVISGLDFAKHYFDNLNPSFLFINGDGNPRFSTEDLGQLYIWDLPFLIIGLLILFKKKEGHWYVLPIWILLGIIPAATARETPHALRTETILPTIQIIIAVGFVYFEEYIKSKISKKNAFALLVLVWMVLGASVFYYLHGYYSHYARESAGQWQYGYKDAYAYARSVEGQYDQINVTQALGRPYIFYLFGGKINPAYFRNNSDVVRDVFGFVHVNRIGKYYFTDEAGPAGKKTLYIRRSDSLPDGVKVLKQFRQPDGYSILSAYVKN